MAKKRRNIARLCRTAATMLLTLTVLIGLTQNVYAAKDNAVTENGLTAELITDKDSYTASESVKAFVKVTNNTGKEVSVSAQIHESESVEIVSKNTTFDVELKAGEHWVTPEEVVLSAVQAADAPDTDGVTKEEEGKDMLIWLIVIALVAIALVVLFVFGKKRKAMLSILLCLALSGGMLAAAMPVQAADLEGEIELTRTITVDGEETELCATVSYVIHSEDDKADQKDDDKKIEDQKDDTSSDKTDTSDKDQSSDKKDDSKKDADTDKPAGTTTGQTSNVTPDPTQNTTPDPAPSEPTDPSDPSDPSDPTDPSEPSDPGQEDPTPEEDLLTVYIKETFEAEKLPSIISIVASANITKVAEANATPANSALRFLDQDTNEHQMQIKGVVYPEGMRYVVYDFDVKIADSENLQFMVRMKNTDVDSTVSNDKYSTICQIAPGGKLNMLSSNYPYVEMTTLNEDTWYNIAVVYDFEGRTRTLYVDGVKLGDAIALEPVFSESGCGPETTEFLTFLCSRNNTGELMLDNIRVYESETPIAMSDNEKKYVASNGIVIDVTQSVFEDTTKVEGWLEGYMALHMGNGMVYLDGTKTKLATTPVGDRLECEVVAEEICSALGVSYSVSGSTVTINGKTATVRSEGGKYWIDAEYFFEDILDKVVTKDDECENYGMMIAGDTTFTWPSTTDLGVHFKHNDKQELNNYLFYERPTTLEIIDAYNSSALQNVHPRIQATASDFDALRTEVATNPLKQSWYNQLIAAAEFLIENDNPLIYELRDGRRLLYVSRDCLTNMYVLGMAYQLTGEEKYAERAWVDLEAVCSFPDWHPDHDLDVSEMCAAVAIGYDWMYDAFDANQRTLMEEAMYNFGLTIAYKWYQNINKTTNNHNIVLNGGYTMAALAVMDVYPEEAAYVVAHAITTADIMLVQFGPDGAWSEGPHYWEYAIQYTSKMLSSLDTIFGTTFELDATMGLDTAADYMLYMQSDLGIFNYGDGTQSNYYVPEMFYLSNIYDKPDTTSAALAMSNGVMTNAEDIVLALLWYDTAISPENVQLDVDGYYPGEGVASFRDKWTDGITSYVGIHGGATLEVHSQVDGGTFVYDYAGVRWATELGSSPYDLTEAGDYSEYGGRWKLYRSRAEAHNAVVINPDQNPDQVVSSTAHLIRYETDNKGAIAVMDLSENYAVNATSAIRGYFFTDDRTSLVVRDEISLKENNSDVYWFLQTATAVEIADDGKSAILSQNGKQVKLEFVVTGTGADSAVLSVGQSVPLATSPVIAGDQYSASTNRIQLKMTMSGDITITVKLTPVGVKSTPLADYNKSIDLWAVPTGEIASKPELLSATIDGRELVFDDTKATIFTFGAGAYTTVPNVNAVVDTQKYDVVIENAAALDGTTTIKVVDKTDANVYSIYTVRFWEIPVPTAFDGMTSYQVVGVTVSDEPEANNHRLNVVDNSVSTRWSAMGVGQWIILELEQAVTVDNLIMSFMNGHARQTYITISTSEDGVTYEEVYSGKSILAASANAADAYGVYDLQGKTAKYIKVVGNGNTSQGVIAGWNSITEIVVTKDGDPAPVSAITIDTQPVSATVALGEEATLTVAASVENATLRYQWYSCTDSNKTGATAIQGASSATYKVTPEELGTTYYYYCKVSASGTTSVDTNVVTVKAPVIFAENFDGSGFAIGAWNIVNGVTSTVPAAGREVVADANDANDKEFKFNAVTTALTGDQNTDTRFASTETWADATATTDRSSQRVVYEFDLELTEDTGTNVTVLLRSHNNGGKISNLCRVVDNVLTLDGSSQTKTLAAGTYKLHIIVDFATKTQSVYVDGIALIEDGAMHNATAFYPQAVNDLLRFALKSGTTTEAFIIDDILIYEVASDWAPPAPVPEITIDTQPEDTPVALGDEATLSIAATVSLGGTVSYQWYSCTDTNKTGAAAIANATSATYQVEPTELGSSTYYFCRVSAEGAESVDSDVVTVSVPVIYAEDFNGSGFTVGGWGITNGVTSTVPAAGRAVVADANDANDKEFKFNAVTTALTGDQNTDARFASTATWADATSVTDRSSQRVVYEFDLELTADTGTNMTVLLRSHNGGGKISNLCKVVNNVLTLEGSSTTKTLAAGTYKLHIIVDFATKTQSVYVDGIALIEDGAMHNATAFYPQAVNDLLRFALKANTTTEAFIIDDICIYEVASDWAPEVPVPVITIGTQPEDTAVSLGEEATLTIAATATVNAVVSYQWYSCTDTNKTDATAIENATSATYQVKPIEIGSSTYYFCRVSATGAQSVDSDVVAVGVATIFAEDFNGSSFTFAGWSGATGVNGIAKSGTATVAVVADATDTSDKALRVSEITTALSSDSNIDARFASTDSWADATATTDRSAQRIVYEFDLKLTADTGTIVKVMLRSHDGGGKVSNLFRLDSNTIVLDGSSKTRNLTAGTYNFQVVCDFATETRDIYINGVLWVEDEAMHNAAAFYPQAVNDLLRFNVKNPTKEFSIDNICIYEVTADWAPEAPVPVITIGTQPTGASLALGGETTLTVAAQATLNAAVSYQWYRCTDSEKAEAEAIENATSATYKVTATQLGSPYYYFCRVSAEGAVSVDSDVVFVAVPAIFAENFDADGFALSAWNTVHGMTKAGNAVVEIVADATDAADKELKVNAITEALSSDSNIDARFGSGTTWADATSVTDRSAQRIAYEFDLELTADSGTTMKVMLRSVDNGGKLSYLFRLSNNVIILEGSSVTKTLTAGTYHFLVVCDFANETRDIYIDGVALTEDEAMHNAVGFNPVAVNDLLRFNVKNETAAFIIDDISIYEVDADWVPTVATAPVPVITIGTQPAAATSVVGQEATLTVAATVTPEGPVSYQWYRCDDADKTGAEAISGATSATYKVTPAEVGSTYYFCRVSATGAESVDSNVITVTAPVIFAENFDDPNFSFAGWSGATGVNGFTTVVPAANREIAADSVNVNDKEYKILATTGLTSVNSDARFGTGTSWADATSTTDRSGQKIAYEFSLKITEATGTNVRVQLRSVDGGGKMSHLCAVINNVLQIEGSAYATKTLEVGEHRIKIVCDFATETEDIYVDGVALVEGANMHNKAAFNPLAVNDLLRFALMSNTATASFSIDNICIYEVK